MKLYKIIEQWLKENRCNGLLKPYTKCSCNFNNLLMCETFNRECKPYRLFGENGLYEIKEENIKAYEIVEFWLKEKNYDGLYNEKTGCDCKLDGLMFCQRWNRDCKAGNLYIKKIIR